MAFLPDDNLDYPVLISSPTNSGSGFYFFAGDTTYLVTAKHVLVDDLGALRTTSATLISYRSLLTQKMELTVDLAILQARGDVILHPIADVAVVKLGQSTGTPAVLPFSAGVSLPPGHPNPGITGVMTTTVNLLSKIGLSNEAFIFGYPNSIGLPGQLEPTKPLIRRGAVAGLNSVNNTIIIDAPAYQGNSGGLVIEVEHEGLTRNFRAIGVLTQFIPFFEQVKSLHFGTINTNIENSGYSVVTPMDRVFELVGLPITP